MRRLFFGHALLSLILLGLTQTVAAQGGTAGLAVTVRDNAGVLPGAIVVATPRGMSRSTRVVTNDQGIASFPDLGPGPVDLRVSFPGFSDAETRVSIEPAGRRAVEVVMSVLRVSE